MRIFAQSFDKVIFVTGQSAGVYSGKKTVVWAQLTAPLQTDRRKSDLNSRHNARLKIIDWWSRSITHVVWSEKVIGEDRSKGGPRADGLGRSGNSLWELAPSYHWRPEVSKQRCPDRENFGQLSVRNSGIRGRFALNCRNKYGTTTIRLRHDYDTRLRRDYDKLTC